MDFKELMATAQMNTQISKKQVEKMRQKETESEKMYKEMEKRRKEYAKSLQKGTPQARPRNPTGTPTTASVGRKASQAVSTGQNGRQQHVAVKQAHAAHTTSKNRSQDLRNDSRQHVVKNAHVSNKSRAQGSVAVKPAGKGSSLKEGGVKETSSAAKERSAAKLSGKPTATKQNGQSVGSSSESKHKAKLPKKKTGATAGQPIAFSQLMKMATGIAEPKQDSTSKQEPTTESTSKSAKGNTVGRDKGKPVVEAKKRNARESTGALQSGPSKKQALGESTGASRSRPSNIRHHVTPTFKTPQPREKAKMTHRTDPSTSNEHRRLAPKGAQQPKHHPSMKSMSFYQAKSGGSGSNSSSRPGHQRVSGSWLDQLGYSMAELQRKRQQQEMEDSEDDDTYDDDDGFVVDDEEAEDVDVASTIKEVFGYDRNKFLHERDDTALMESSYSQQQFEERRSARIGRQEDDEEARKEAMEQKRKVKVLKKAKSGPKQRKLTF